MRALEDAWREVTGKDLPDNVREYVTARIQEEGEAE